MYHVKLKCYVVIELKAGRFKPEYIGKLQFYTTAIDHEIKDDTDNPTIGLLLCQSSNGMIVEYCLKDTRKPIGVSNYTTRRDDVQKYLPTQEQFQHLIDTMDLQPNPNRRIWFIVDELASLNKFPSLDMALAEGRKYGVCIVLGFQNMAQIQEIYGTQGIKSIRELMVSKFSFQAVDPENAKALSQIFGEKQFIESHENISYGANEIRDGISLSHHKKREALVDYEKLMNLEPLHFYAKIAHINHCLRDNFSYCSRKVCSVPFIENKNMSDTILGRRHQLMKLHIQNSSSNIDHNQLNELVKIHNISEKIKKRGA